MKPFDYPQSEEIGHVNFPYLYQKKNTRNFANRNYFDHKKIHKNSARFKREIKLTVKRILQDPNGLTCAVLISMRYFAIITLFN